MMAAEYHICLNTEEFRMLEDLLRKAPNQLRSEPKREHERFTFDMRPKVIESIKEKMDMALIASSKGSDG
jgi:hypothetical protein